MANWHFRTIKCPSCKRVLREPVNLHQPPGLDFKSINGEPHNIYRQTCHRCATLGASGALQTVYDQAHARIKAVCVQKEGAERNG